MNKTDEYLINLFLKSVNDDFYFNEDINDIDFENGMILSSNGGNSAQHYYVQQENEKYENEYERQILERDSNNNAILSLFHTSPR